MSHKARTNFLVSAIAGAIALSFSASAFAVDATAAKVMARKNSCLRCHSVTKKKEGPSYQSVAYKYKDKSDAADVLIKHITSGEKVKLTDGHQEEHKITKSKDPAEIKNLIDWILAQ